MPGLNYRLVVPPTVEPISLSTAKKQLRIDIPDDDELITSVYIPAAREFAERLTNRAFYTQTWQYFKDNFPYGDYRSTVSIDQREPWNYSAYWNDFAFRLPKPRLLSVTSVNYLDAQGNPQVLDPTLYYVDMNSEPGRITPQIGGIWPMTQFYLPGSINVVYQAGSYVGDQIDTLTVPTQAPFTVQLSRQVIGITSVKDANGNPLTYTMQPVSDANNDPTELSTLTFATQPAGPVVVIYQASILPPTLKAAILLILGHLYENREDTTELNLKTLPLAAKNFIRPHVFNVFGNYETGF